MPLPLAHKPKSLSLLVSTPHIPNIWLVLSKPMVLMERRWSSGTETQACL